MRRLLSHRWWFGHRKTGNITIAQPPNWPLYAIAALWVLRRIVDPAGDPYLIMGWVSTALWLFWGIDEIVRGVNPWRRLLGAGVVIWQVVGIIS